MKIWKKRTFADKKFRRLNHGEIPKSKFALHYYRILHTAYLKQEHFCMSAVKKLFAESFGHEPNTWSVNYMSNKERFLINDTITDSLNKSGRLEYPDCLLPLFVEIGFDVYLIQSIEENTKLSARKFRHWLPLKKDRKLKHAVKHFWKYRLPKEKLLKSLYYQLEPYKNEILTTYRNMLTENTAFVSDIKEKDAILAYITQALGLAEVTSVLEACCAQVYDEIDEESAQEAAVVTEESSVQNSVAACEAQLDEHITVTEPMEENNCEPVCNLCEPVEEEKKPVTAQAVPKIVTVKPVSAKTVSSVKPTSAPRGFNPGNQLTRKKMLTCAVCVAAAGALLVPLVAYSVVKNK